MKKALFIFTTLLLSLVLNPISVGAQELEALNEITIFNTKTVKHTAIEGFDYAIVLPNTGYKQTKANFMTKFENEVDEAEISIDQPIQDISTSFYVNDSGYTNYNINNTSANLRKRAYKGKMEQTLYLATPKPMYVVGTCKLTDTTNINKIERSLLSIVYTGPIADKASNNKYNNSLFSIESNGFKTENTGLMLTLFTKSGNHLEEQKEGKENYFQVLTIKDKVDVKQHKKEAKKITNSLIEKKDKISKGKQIEINGKKAFEFNVAKSSGAKSYMTVTFSKDHIFVFLANSNAEIEKNMATFKSIARTLEIK